MEFPRYNTWFDHLAEAGWLVALVVTASFFNPYSNRTFEPDRVLLLQAIALVMAVGWLVQALQGGFLPRGAGTTRALQSFLRSPMVAPALIYGLVMLLTTLTAVVPSLSFWGSYGRRQGAYAVLAYLVLFLLARRGLRDPARRERLVSVLICTSVPVAVYGLLQGLGWDPVIWTTGFGERVSSTLGNPIFLGAYLIMVAPFVLVRLVSAWAEPAGRERLSEQSEITGFASVGRKGRRSKGRLKSALRPHSRAFQTGSEARQPQRSIVIAGYGVILALHVACLLLGRSRGPALGFLAGTLALVFFAALAAGRRRWALLLAGAVLALALAFALALILQPEAVRQALPFERGTALQRILTWQGVTHMAGVSPLRALLGYGPDSMVVAFPPFYPPELAPIAGEPDQVFDRAHNEVLEHLATTGLAGVGAYLLVLGGFFFYVLRGLGLIPAQGPARWFLAMMAIGLLAGALLPRWLEGSWRFAGLGVGAGAVAALFAYGAYAAWRLFPARRSWGQAGLLVAALAAVVAHVVEGQFGIEVAATRLLFWLLVALAAVIGDDLSQLREEASTPSSQPEASPAALRLVALVVALLMSSLAFDFIHREVRIGEAVITLAALLIVAWGTGAFVTWDSSAGRLPGWFSAYTLTAWGWFLVFLLPHVVLSGVWHNGVAALGAFYLYLLVTVILAAVTQTERPKELVIQVDLRALGCLLLLIVGGVLIIFTNLNVAWADVVLKAGFDYADRGQWDETIAAFERAVRLAPHQDFYATHLAGAYMRKGTTFQDPSQVAVWFAQSQAALEQGWRRNPRNYEFPARLGLLHRFWAERSRSVPEYQAHLRQAVTFYTQAVALNPQNARIHRELGMTYHDLGDLTRAVAEYRRSQALRPEIVETYLLLGQAILEQGDVAAAGQAYAEAIARDRTEAQQRAESLAAEQPDSYSAHLGLATLYWQLGELDKAQAEAEAALRLAPATAQPTVEHLIAILQGQVSP